MNKKRIVKISVALCALLFYAALFFRCSYWYFIADNRESLPSSGKWKCETHETIIVDFDNKTITIDEIHTAQLTITDETFLEALVPVEGAQGNRGLMGHCVIATDEKFCIKSKKNDEHWWFYKIDNTD